MTRRNRPAPNARPFDLLAVGHAIVDVLTHSSDEFLVEHRLPKGHMQLIDHDRADALYGVLGPAMEVSGGSAANTVVGLASLGGTAAFLGTVSDDQLGEFFRHDLRAAGVGFDVAPVTGHGKTGRCLVVITPDGQRTMNTYLGAATAITEEHIDESLFSQSSVVFVEGYLFDIPRGEQLFKHIATLSKENGCLLALTLSDPFVIQRYRSAIDSALDLGVDILFVNDDELQALFPGVPFDQAVDVVKKMCPWVVVTRGAAGSLVTDHGEVVAVSAFPAPVTDTTGAGDIYAAGFLYGFTKGESIEQCGVIASAAASEVIAHVGARPEVELRGHVATVLMHRQEQLFE